VAARVAKTPPFFTSVPSSIKTPVTVPVVGNESSACFFASAKPEIETMSLTSPFSTMAVTQSGLAGFRIFYMRKIADKTKKVAKNKYQRLDFVILISN
jgi:hypothetical protein